MNRYTSDSVCKNCGYSYGEHRWDDDACPITAEQNYPGKFVEGSLFVPVVKDEGGTEGAGNGKGEEEMKHLRYFAWNAFITGTLVVGYIVDEMVLAGRIIGAVYVFIFVSLLIAFLASFIEEGRLLAERLNKAGYSWHIITDIIFVISAGYMGYKKIAVCMFVELAACLYLTAWAMVKKAEENNDHS